jgi:hypothetical protein
MAGFEIDDSQVRAGLPHRLSETAAGDVAERVPIAIEEQHRLGQTPAVGRGAGAERNARSAFETEGSLARDANKNAE